MLRIEPAVAFPSELMNDLNESASFGLSAWKALSGYVLRMSSPVYTVYEGETPLLIIGAFKPSTLSGYFEVWMLGTTKFKAKHLREGRKLFLAWVHEQTKPIIARCNTLAEERFARFFGFQFVTQDTATGIKTYEVLP